MAMSTVRRLVPVKGSVTKVRKLARLMRHPVRRMSYRSAARGIRRRDDLADMVDQRTGYAFIPPGAIPGVDEAVRFCQSLLDERRDRPDLWPIPPRKYKDYPLPILKPYEPADAPPVFDLVLSEPILQIASDYLGEVPVLETINIWWTPQNQELRGSQFYHRDTLSWSERQAKFVFNLSDVDEDAGPFTFIPADVSDRIVARFGSPPERVPDEVVFQTAQPEDVVPIIGPAGTGCVVDSSRCFHFGSRCRGKERLALVFHFRPYLSPDRKRKVRKVSADYFRELNADPVRRLVYRVAARS